MMQWVDEFMWWLMGTLGYALELVGVAGLILIAAAWMTTRVEEMIERDS